MSGKLKMRAEGDDAEEGADRRGLAAAEAVPPITTAAIASSSTSFPDDRARR